MSDNDFFSDDRDFAIGESFQDDDRAEFIGSLEELNRAAAAIQAEHAELVEETILNGANRVETCDLRGRTVVLSLPSVLRRPIVRFKIHRARNERGVKTNVDRTVVIEGG
jgi:hypothetical protein